MNVFAQFHLATIYFFLRVIFCVWCRPSPLDCYYPSALATSVNLLPPSILTLHPEQKQAAKHTGRQKQQQTAKLQGQKRTMQSISRHLCLVQNQGALRKHEEPGDDVERGETRLAKQEMKLDYRGLTVSWLLFIGAHFLQQSPGDNSKLVGFK